MNCDKCGKPSTNLLLSPVQNGPNGYRRYKLCQKCRGGGNTVKPSDAANSTNESATGKVELPKDATK